MKFITFLHMLITTSICVAIIFALLNSLPMGMLFLAFAVLGLFLLVKKED